MSAAFDELGNQLKLGKKLGEGGEGAVFDAMHNGENVAAKIYSQALPPERQAKLRAMAQVGDTYLKQIAAWPISVLLTNRPGPVTGFTMPKFSGYEPVHQLYGVASRRQTFPKVDFSFLVGTARNIAAAFDAIHAHGHAIGDVNENNIIVSHQGTVKLLDCDSFHVNTGTASFPCTVGVPHYTPPELQGLGSFHGVTRTANHDNFGLAVLIFQLLFMARHPFSGVPKIAGDLPLERAIREFRFAYGADRLARLNDMPPRALGLDYLPPAMGDLFWRAFTEAGAKYGRPKAKEWVAALDSLLQSLRSCSTEPRHKYPGQLNSCVWCERDKLGTPYFTPASATGPSINFHVMGANISALWSQIQALSALPPLPVYTPQSFNVTGRPAPASVSKGLAKTRLTYVAICFFAFLMSFAVPKLWPLWLVIGAAVIHGVKPPTPIEFITRKSVVDSTKRAYEQALSIYENLRTDRRLSDKAREVGQIKAQLDGLPQVLAQELKQLQASLVARQLHDFLDRHFIRAAKIAGVGEQRKQTLVSFGIESAADVTESAIAAIPGFGAGLTANLLAWRRRIEQRFVPVAGTSPTPQDISAVNSKVASMRTRLEQQLKDGATKLQEIRNDIVARQNSARSALETTSQALAQAEADLAVMQVR
ncbi:helix-hairpin-helix domain-containing protein [Paraburkholderia sp.]|uniref:helix-hairpin-helix domain-containing protein n=1 Tax=Paraburkholderia sp. TaxID=1926495 RepID=UPI003C7D7DFA